MCELSKASKGSKMQSLCLCLAVGFSWMGFMSTFSADVRTSPRELAMTSLASSICLGAIAVAFSAGVTYGGLIVMIGLFVAHTLGDVVTPLPSLGVSAAGLAIYLNASAALAMS
jgi:hypothetical protein